MVVNCIAFLVFLDVEIHEKQVIMEVIRFDEMKKTWHQIARHHDGAVLPSFELELYRKMLDIFHVGDFYYYILNIAQVEMEFVSDTVQKVMGIAPEHFTVEFIFDNIHPDDKDRFIAYEQKVTAFFNSLSPEKVMKYKVSYDYRLRSADGSYRWILMQTITIQSNEEGAVIRVLGVQTDITHLKTDHTGSGLSFLGMEGEPSFYNVSVAPSTKALIPSGNLFSRRETEILNLILAGKSSVEIAAMLHLSIHTINTHRKNIFSKSDCKTLVELGAKAIKEGWL